jgi:Putative lumazine-binding
MNTEQQTGNKEDSQIINAILQDYFDGLYEGDVAKLQHIFHDDAWLKGNNFRKSRDEWLAAVATRPIPKDKKMDYGFKVISLDVVGDQAMAKVDVPLLAAHYIDFLGLLKENGSWKIVNKMYTII